ncbi:MAG TPA: GNAT family N-acetyltransferase [Roseiflexaceae bacterium]|nr:GNAT family N-acetyltransferase [Roseiflexaceae bacterium]
MSDYLISEASPADADVICEVLAESGLSSHAVLAPGTRYWLARYADGAPVGAIGLEVGAGAALLRSAAVRPAARGRGIGAALLRRALAEATTGGQKQVYLFSTDAGAYWSRQGFSEVPVPELVAALPDAPQVRHYDEQGWLPDEVAWRRDLYSF